LSSNNSCAEKTVPHPPEKRHAASPVVAQVAEFLLGQAGIILSR
jgi:hypothetical protein